jgi:hypothetical protein
VILVQTAQSRQRGAEPKGERGTGAAQSKRIGRKLGHEQDVELSRKLLSGSTGGALGCEEAIAPEPSAWNGNVAQRPCRRRHRWIQASITGSHLLDLGPVHPGRQMGRSVPEPLAFARGGSACGRPHSEAASARGWGLEASANRVVAFGLCIGVRGVRGPRCALRPCTFVEDGGAVLRMAYLSSPTPERVTPRPTTSRGLAATTRQ